MADPTSLLGPYWPLVAGTIERIVAILASVHVVLRKRDTRSAIGWVGIIWLAPFVGSILYFLFGINRLHRQGTRLQRMLDATMSRLAIQTPVCSEVSLMEVQRMHPELAQQAELVGRITRQPLLSDNEVVPLLSGEETYATMLEAIAQARHSIGLQTYIFGNDSVGRRLAEALRDAQDRGVEVRVLLDDVGSRWLFHTSATFLRGLGLPTAMFLPTRVPHSVKYANLRNHRKILVIDGAMGFTGGMNISADCVAEDGKPLKVRDIHFRLRGPVVAHLLETFVADWAFTTGEILGSPRWDVRPEPRGVVWARGIPDGPDEAAFETLLMTLLGAISMARDKLWIATPYFLPDVSIIHALGTAALRGVEVSILVPARNNHRIVQWASAAPLTQVLEKGCRVYLSPPPFDHSKLTIVDDLWTLFGSTNWDPRSLRLNFEFNVESYDRQLAGRLSRFMASRLQDARELTLDELRRRPFPVQLRDGVARLATPYI